MGRSDKAEQAPYWREGGGMEEGREERGSEEGMEGGREGGRESCCKTKRIALSEIEGM